MESRANSKFSFALAAVAASVFLVAAAFAFTVGDPYANTSFIVDFDFVTIAGDQNSTSFNATISGSALGDTNVNSSNQTGGIFYNITYGIIAGATEVTSTSSTTTTAAAGLSGVVAYSTSADNKVSGITVDPGANVTIKAFTNVSLTSINIISNRTISNAGITAKKVEESALTVAKPAEKSYQFIQIDKTNIQEIDLRTVKIKFSVEKTWLTQNGVAETQIALQRHETAGWRKLPTKKISDDGMNIGYESDSPGLSIYAVTVLPVGEAPPSTIPEVTTSTAPTATTAQATTTTSAPLEKPSEDYTGLIIAVVLILSVAVWHFTRKK